MIKRILIVLVILTILLIPAIPVYADATISASNPTNITDTSATLNGVITDMGGNSWVNVNFQYGDSYGISTPTQYFYSASAFNAKITGLVKGQTYTYRVAYYTPTAGVTQYTGNVSFVAETSVPVGVNNQWQLIPSNPSDPGLYNEMHMTFLGAGWLSTFASLSTIPIDLIVMVYAYGSALILGLVAYRLTMGKTNKYQKAGAMQLRPGSLFVQAMVSGLVIVYFSFAGGGVIPSWSIIPFVIEAITTIIVRQNNGQVVGG